MPLSKKGDQFGKLVDEIGAFGPRANQAHVAAQNIKELRQLIDARATDKPADTSNPEVTFRRPDWSTIRFGIKHHAAEFQQHEVTAVEPTRSCR
jgi:hypothetical protein